MVEERTPVVAKVGSLLRAVGASEPEGQTTTEIGLATSIPRASAHRLLTCLLEEGLVDRSPINGRWFLGPELYLLGRSAADRYDVSDIAREAVESLARKTGESAFFSAQRGDETVCLVRRDGSFPLRSHVLYEGIRFPLGVASAGLVILAHLGDREVDAFLARRDLTERWGDQHAPGPLRQRISSTRRTGYALNPGLIVEGSWGMGAAVFDRRGRPEWALSLTGVESRFRPDRQQELGRLLLDHAHALGQKLASTRPGRRP